MSLQVMLIAAYDSQLKWVLHFAAEFRARGWQYTVVVPSDIRSALSPAQLAAAGDVAILRIPWADMLQLARRMDCVVLAVQGPLVARFTDELELLRRASPSSHEPVVVTGWVGIIIEKLVAGYLDRAGSDVIAVNSADNLRGFTGTGRRLGIPPDNLFLSGLPLLPARPAPRATGPIRTVLFADQPTVPEARWDRAYLYLRLIEYARSHPARTVLLKPRHRPDEGTFHVMQDHPEHVLSMLGELPPNFAITYEGVTGLLDSVDLVLTVSSTAGLEAIGHGVRTVFVADLGIHEKHGNQVLVASGLIATFDDVLADRIPVADPEWLEDVFVGDGPRPVARIVQRVTELTAVAPADRPGRVVAAGPYLSGRVAIRRHRHQLPAIARDPAENPSASRWLLPWLVPLVRRGHLVLRAILPAAWYQGALRTWRRVSIG